MENWNVIFSYSRAQAIADGVLVDVTATAKEAGFRFPTAITAAAWEGVVVPDETGRSCGQSETGRLWDVLACLRHAIRTATESADTVFFDVLVLRGGQTERARLKAVIGPGDDPAPVLTLMNPDED